MHHASACSLAIKEYGHALSRTTRTMRSRAARISALARDLSELLPDLVDRRSRTGCVPTQVRTAGLALPLHLAARPAAARRRDASARAGIRRAASPRARAICAAARPAPIRCCSRSSRTRCATASSGTCTELEPQCIVSANMGCIQHLQSGTDAPGEALDRGAGRGARIPTRPSEAAALAALRVGALEKGVDDRGDPARVFPEWIVPEPVEDLHPGGRQRVAQGLAHILLHDRILDCPK